MGCLHHTGKQHIGQSNIHAKYSGAIGLGRHIGTRGRFANERPVFAILQGNIFRCLTRCTFGQFTKVRGLARCVAHHALCHFEFLQWHFPLIRRSHQQTGFGGSCRSAQMFPGIFNGRGATCGIHTQLAGHLAHNPFTAFHDKGLVEAFRLQRVKRQGTHKHGHVAINAIVPRLFQTHFGQGHIELFGHQHGQCVVNALPHVASVHGQNHIAIFGNFDPAIQCNSAFSEQHVVWFTQA